MPEKKKLNAKIFCERVRFGRLLNDNMTQVQLASKTHCSQQYISQIEKGKKEPSFDFINKLSEVLGVSVEWLLGLVEFYNN